MASTCCFRNEGKKYFEELNRAFVEDPDIDEMDVIICPDCEKELHKAEGLVVVENHKLGVKSWGVKYLYLYTYKRLMEQWRQNDKDCSLSATEVIQLTRSVLLFGPECYTAWNIRKELITSKVLSAAQDLQFSSLVLTKHPRSSETFAHRRWLISYLFKQKGESHCTKSWLRQELSVCFRAADEYSGNYTVWSHRCWLMEKFFPENKKKLASELHFLKQWTQMHVSDNCGFHYRQVVIQHLKNLCSPKEAAMLLLSELEVIRDLILAFPGHEALWYHRRFVFHTWKQWFGNISMHSLNTEPVCLAKERTEKAKANQGEKKKTSIHNEIGTNEGCEPSSLPSRCVSLEQDCEPSVAVSVAPSISDEQAFCAHAIEVSHGTRQGELQKSLATSYRQWMILSNRTCSG